MKIAIDLGDRGYDIHIDPGLIARSGDLLAESYRGRKLFIVTDENVAPYWLAHVEQALASKDLRFSSVTLPAGEQTKNWQQLERLTDWLLEAQIERNDCLIALGGGVIGDLTGFAASIVKRGCDFVQIPTSLLAQVDSSVGGKTAINSRAGKNLIGSFYQPRTVLIDPDVLTTLPDRELRAGYAEVVKYGLINDAEFFGWCEANCRKILDRDQDALIHAIGHSIRQKADIVALDERETAGVRALLNLGHTFGHALEAETGFSDRLVHGEAVAAGMGLAFGFSSRIGLCDTANVERVRKHLQAAGLPCDLNSAEIGTDGDTLVDHMRKDKKMSGGKLPFILARGIGQSFIAKNIELSDVAEYLDSELRG